MLYNYIYYLQELVPFSWIEGMNMLEPNETLPIQGIVYSQHPDTAFPLEVLALRKGDSDDLSSK